jgi:Domain of unknown function (DUF4123)
MLEVQEVAEERLPGHRRYNLLKQQQGTEILSVRNVKQPKKRNRSRFSIFILVMMEPVSDQTSGIIVEGKTVAGFLWDLADNKMGNLYAIVDSAKNEEVFKYLLTDNVTYRSLFEGKMDIKLFGVSGFLIECKKDSKLFNWLTTEAWGTSCSIFFISKAPFDEVFSHFQKFIRVYLEDDDVVYFRYYDPRVLRIYLPTCNSKEISTFFGEIKSFFVESENTEALTEFQRYSTSWSDKLVVSNHEIKYGIVKDELAGRFL